jgi:hypothetical protein
LVPELSLGGVSVSEASPYAPSWVEPGTRDEYPTSYPAYRRTREAQEKTPPRHRGLGPDLDRYLSRRWRGRATSDVDVVLTFRPGAPLRVQRIVGEILRAIRRGRPAGDAIRHVARRFGLRHAHARAFITAGIAFEIRTRHDPKALIAEAPCSSSGPLADWM